MRTLRWAVRSVLASLRNDQEGSWVGQARGRRESVGSDWGTPGEHERETWWGLGGQQEVCGIHSLRDVRRVPLGYLEVILYIGNPTSVKATIVPIFIYFNLLQNHQSSVASLSDFKSDSFGISIFLWKPLQAMLCQWCLNIFSLLVRSTNSWEIEKDQIYCGVKDLFVYSWYTCDVCQMFPLTGVACLLILIDYCWLALLRKKKV